VRVISFVLGFINFIVKQSL